MRWYRLVLLLSATLSLRAEAQTPDYFGNSPVWRLNVSSSMQGGCVTNYRYVYYVMQDTVIDGMQYQQIGKRGRYSQQNVGAPPFSCTAHGIFDNPFTFVRQQGRQVYQPNSMGPDHLLLDFGLNAGDTLPIVSGPGSDTLIVSSVDSVLLGNNYHRRTTIDNTFFGTRTLVEGLGFFTDTHGEFFGSWDPGISEQPALVCYAQNGTTLYTDQWVGSQCDYLIDLGVGEEVVEWRPSIFYHSDLSALVIDIPEPATGSVMVYDINGRLLLTQDMLSLGANFIHMNMRGGSLLGTNEPGRDHVF